MSASIKIFYSCESPLLAIILSFIKSAIGEVRECLSSFLVGKGRLVGIGGGDFGFCCSWCCLNRFSDYFMISALLLTIEPIKAHSGWEQGKFGVVL